MNILDEIMAHKAKEVAARKELFPAKLLEQSIYFNTNVVSMKRYLQRDDKVGIIAEFKRKSPSTGELKINPDVEQITLAYMQAGATALSVLTDENYFGGKSEDLTTARKYNYCPVLRKDFILDEYQLIEAKSIGADCILLIAACLEPERCRELAAFARSLGLEVLLEVHDEAEINSHVNPAVDIVGVNNRNLKNFTTNIGTSLRLADLIPSDFAKISESGITRAEQIVDLKAAGFEGFLIGGHFMKQAQPGQACKQLIDELQTVSA